MYDEYRARMNRRGSYMGETMHMQSDMVVNATWMNSIAVRPVQVKLIDSGLPPTYSSAEEFDETLWAHFDSHSKYNISGDEVDYYLTFRPGEMLKHPEIKIGAYVCIPNVDGIPEWWIMVHISDDNELKTINIIKCNYTFKWVTDGKVYTMLGCQRYASSYNSGAFEMDRTTSVDNITGIWLPTNSDSETLGYNQRLIISDGNRMPPLVWQISKIISTTPVGVTKFSLTQETYSQQIDNAELGLANYYNNGVEVVSINDGDTSDAFNITYTGTKPNIRVGGSKTFTAELPDNFDISWAVSDGENTYDIGYDNITSTFGSYIITTTDRTLCLKLARDYDLIGKMLTITAHCANGDNADIQVEVIS